MADPRSKELNMLDGPILPRILQFTLPLAATGMLQLLFNAADVIVVGKFSGSIALAAVGATSTLVNLIVNTFIGISVGVNILVARRIGCHDADGVSRASHCAVALSALLGLLVMAIGLLFSRPMLEWMETPADILEKSTLYLKLYFLGVPFTLIYNFGAAILRAYGDTRRPLIYLTVSGVVNALLNLFFVIVCKIDVAGVAIATVISQVISVFLVMRCLLRFDGWAKISLRQIRLYRDEAVQMLQIGLPAGLQSMLFNISNVMVQSAVNSFGADVVAANTASGNIGNFTYTAQNSVYHAAITFTSQNLGARRYDRIDRIFWGSCAAVCIIGVPLSLLSTVFGPQLLGIYIARSDPAYDAIIQNGVIRNYYVIAPYILCGLMDTTCGMVRGLGRAWLPMLVSLTGACLLRIVWIWTFFRWTHTLEMLYISYPISWIVTAAVHAVCYFVIWKKLRAKLEQAAPQTEQKLPTRSGCVQSASTSLSTNVCSPVGSITCAFSL